ncbi:hypothetical protein GLOTRDRAFT_110857 [Gloeophyllum trabeum ATCC 11539]|uniref:Uncharacterized protein n=1 Tax=Gloeophyllum trabeum (strain ATCC 11539 / FP-39264 / Madison 617) TaxID=670483 RepID=S7Q9J5_GLOTA|nr:uncharacterized protein GLOTRDRAFT_110857 [Gloeophyllum trabeum ATCC 11539]EPQ56596.1 hypothetical protein GLOTRDRAFT_110857 [Gloeophyllum trabeum ATCC 11539]
MTQCKAKMYGKGARTMQGTDSRRPRARVRRCGDSPRPSHTSIGTPGKDSER